MHFVNADRALWPIFPAAGFHPLGVTPLVTLEVVNEGCSRCSMLAKERKGITLEQKCPGMCADLEFVMRTFADAGNEQFPDACAEESAHRMHPAITLVEIPHHAHPLRIRRPNCEIHAGITVNFAHVRAELVVNLPVLPFAEEMQINLTHDRSIAVGIAHRAVRSVPIR